MSSIIEHSDPTNAQILAVSEDQIKGFVREPFLDIAAKSGVPIDTVLHRIRTMLEAGTIRERVLTKADVAAATRLWLINSVREWIDATLVAR